MFVEDGSTFAMTGVDFGVVRQMEQPLDNAGAQLLIVTARQVGAADAAAEERVTREDPALDLGIETDTALGVSRGADDFQSALSHLDDLFVGKVDVGQVDLGIAFRPKSQPRRVTLGVNEVCLHVGMRRHLDAKMVFDGVVADDMVDVAVCVDDHQGLETVAVDKTKERVFLGWRGTARVDDDTFLGGIVIDDVGVFREGIEYEGFEFEHSCIIEPALRQAQGPTRVKVVELVETPTVFSRAKVRFF